MRFQPPQFARVPFVARVAGCGAAMAHPAALRQWLVARGDSVHTDVGEIFERLVAECDALPLPGGGRTLERWDALAQVAAANLSLVKLYEGHTDALAILAELGADPEKVPRSGARWAVWAAENPHTPLMASTRGGAELVLHGRKDWCSGASAVTHALVTTSTANGESLLAAVGLAQPGIHVDSSDWRAVGMARTGTAALTFDGARAWPIGRPGSYLARPGFWHGGAGIAACWLGAARVLADVVRESVARRDDPHARAHLGTMMVALQSARALMRTVASRIDLQPAFPHRPLVMCLRASAESAAQLVLTHAGRALGAAPYCKDATFARHAADLPVFLRQSHAERDLATIGADVIAGEFDNQP